MKAVKGFCRVAVTAVALSVWTGTPSHAQDDEATRLAQKVVALYEAGHFAEALPLARQSLALREKELGPDDTKVATSLNVLGLVQYSAGNYDDAEPLYKRSLAIFEKALGPEREEVAGVLNNLGELYRMEARSPMPSPCSSARLPFARKRPVPTPPISCRR